MNKKPSLTRNFKLARVKFVHKNPQIIGRELDTAALNARLCASAHRAVEEIARAVSMMGSPRIGCTRYDDVPPSGSGDWSEAQAEVWDRFRRWSAILGPIRRKQRDAVILFSQGHRPRHIEQRFCTGGGWARRNIEAGLRAYADLF